MHTCQLVHTNLHQGIYNKKSKDLACQQSTWKKFLLNRPWGKLPPPNLTPLSHILSSQDEWLTLKITSGELGSPYSHA